MSRKRGIQITVELITGERYSDNGSIKWDRNVKLKADLHHGKEYSVISSPPAYFECSTQYQHYPPILEQSELYATNPHTGTRFLCHPRIATRASR